MSMLEGEPGQTYKIRNDRPEQETETEIAEADENGILRDSCGRSYSSGAYEVLEEVDDE